MSNESRVVIEARNPSQIDPAYSIYYSRLADVFFDILRARKPKIILEAGSGRGQLTIPLLERLPRTSLVCVDSSKGPYVSWMSDLESKIDRSNLSARVQLVKSDVRQMKSVRSGGVDAVVSNELICDLTKPSQLGKAFIEFRRVLKPKGLMIHGEWSSWQESKKQALTVKHSPSWNLDQLFALMARHGFHHLRSLHFDTTINFARDAALAELRTWGAKGKSSEKKILGTYRSMLLPFEHIVVAEK